MNSPVAEGTVEEKWLERYERLSGNVEGIRKKLKRDDLTPNRKANLEWLLRYLEDQIIRKHLGGQPLS